MKSGSSTVSSGGRKANMPGSPLYGGGGGELSGYDVTSRGRLLGIMEELGEDDLVILYGFSLVPMMYRYKSIDGIVQFFDSLLAKLTLLVECLEEFHMVNL